MADPYSMQAAQAIRDKIKELRSYAPAAKVAGELAVGLSPAGPLLDARDIAQDPTNPWPYLFAMPVIGDASKFVKNAKKAKELAKKNRLETGDAMRDWLSKPPSETAKPAHEMVDGTKEAVKDLSVRAPAKWSEQVKEAFMQPAHKTAKKVSQMSVDERVEFLKELKKYSPAYQKEVLTEMRRF